MNNPARPASERPARSTHRTRTAGAWPAGYAIVLIVVGAGLLVTWDSSHYARNGIALVGCALLGAAAARLVLPERYLGMLACRSKAFDVAAYALLGGGVLGLALVLP